MLDFVLCAEFGSSTKYLSKVKHLFGCRGLNNFLEFRLGKRKALVGAPRGSVDNYIFQPSANELVIAAGTAIYKGKWGREALRALWKDFLKERISLKEIKGDYVLLFWDSRNLTMATSPGNLLPLYYNSSLRCASTSFLALALMMPLIKIRKGVLLHNILTGCIIGARTYINGLNVVDDLQILCKNGIIDNYLTFDDNYSSHCVYSSLEEAAQAQIDALRCFFNRVTPVLQKKGVWLGLSGGYDSRLLYILARETGSRLRVYTHYKPDNDKEVSIARKIASRGGAELIEVKVRGISQMSREEICKNLERAFWACDGQVRLNWGWASDYRQKWYRKLVAGGAGVGLDGVGGERYRNFTYFLGKMKGEDWIRLVLINEAGYFSLSREERAKIAEDLWILVSNEIGWNKSDKVTLEAVHRFYNTIWLRNRAVQRVRLGNEIGMFLLPFADLEVANSSKNIIGFLGVGGGFEGAMIRMLDESLACIPSVYYSKGFPVANWRECLKGCIKYMLPYNFRFFWRYLEWEKACIRYDERNSLFFSDVKSMEKYLEPLEDLSFPVDVKRLFINREIGERALALGFALRKLL